MCCGENWKRRKRLRRPERNFKNQSIDEYKNKEFWNCSSSWEQDTSRSPVIYAGKKALHPTLTLARWRTAADHMQAHKKPIDTRELAFRDSLDCTVLLSLCGRTQLRARSKTPNLHEASLILSSKQVHDGPSRQHPIKSQLYFFNFGIIIQEQILILKLYGRWLHTKFHSVILGKISSYYKNPIFLVNFRPYVVSLTRHDRR